MFKKWKLSALALALITVSCPLPGVAQFGSVVYCTNCSTEPTQLSINSTQSLQYAKQLLQYAIQVQQIADALMNSAHRGPVSLTNIAADLGQLASVIQGGRAIAYSLGNQDVFSARPIPGTRPWGQDLACRPHKERMPASTQSGLRLVLLQPKEYFAALAFKENSSPRSRACSGF
jgi:hypothetical protein